MPVAVAGRTAIMSAYEGSIPGPTLRVRPGDRLRINLVNRLQLLPDALPADSPFLCTILDRAQDMLIRGGENIYCAEVENVLAQHPAVADAALIGLPHPLLGEVPAALVQTRPGMALSERALQAFAVDRLAAFKVPVRVHVSQAALPRNDGGKLVKTELRKVFGTEVQA